MVCSSILQLVLISELVGCLLAKKLHTLYWIASQLLSSLQKLLLILKMTKSSPVSKHCLASQLQTECFIFQDGKFWTRKLKQIYSNSSNSPRFFPPKFCIVWQLHSLTNMQLHIEVNFIKQIAIYNSVSTYKSLLQEVIKVCGAKLA